MHGYKSRLTRAFANPSISVDAESAVINMSFLVETSSDGLACRDTKSCMGHRNGVVSLDSICA